ncbi:hypothetical protein SHK09_10835 [Polaribacter sp. PL03]|uniref:hypothetical protein n=1 Tax=Polaribacter sp. PL03 TaxID=3088353 RepID=UPI0029CD51EA|nr:hypothetical protein [Polaribacter sp. PL03]MDX6747288.1 hypothetical protein [Polaribacter sp. PL03]
MNLDWTKKEFEAYVLLYAAHCNHVEDIAEQKYIRTKVDEKTFHRIHTEVVVDSDEDNLNKIQYFVSENHFTEDEKETLLRDVKQVFFADGTVDIIEKKAYSILKKMIG